MKRKTVHKAVIGVFGAALLLAAAGCSSGQKKADLGAPAGAGSTTGTAASASASDPSTASSPATGSAGSPSSSSAASSSAAPAPVTVTSKSGGWSFTGTVPGGDADSAAAMAAFQKYRADLYMIDTKADYTKDISTVADGNALTLANNAVLSLKQANVVMTGTQTDTVTSTKLDMTAKPLPVMTISVCKDSTKLHMVTASGPNKGKLAGKDSTHPIPLIYTVHKSGDGKWRVSDLQTFGDKSC